MANNEQGHNVARVYYDPVKENADIVINLKYENKWMKINRNPNENLGSSLNRLSLNLAKKLKTKKGNSKKSKTNLGTEIFTGDDLTALKLVLLDKGQNKIDLELSNKIAWSNGRFMRVNENYIPVFFNPPTIDGLTLIEAPMVGMPIVPQMKLTNATPERCRYLWYRGKKQTDIEVNGVQEMQVDGISMFNDEEWNWELICEKHLYVVKEEDKGFKIKVEVKPITDGENLEDIQSERVSAVTLGNVLDGPPSCYFDDRIKQTAVRVKDSSFRFVCYNILADVYSNTDYARDFLFPYCPTDALKMCYRQQLLSKEIKGYHGDIICLQEVDRWMFEEYMMPIFSHIGFAGCFGLKHLTKEGVALFYRRDRFRLLNAENVILKNAIQNEELYKDLWDRIKTNKMFEEGILRRTTCVLICLLQSVDDPQKHLLVGNTHLYWHPRAGNIRAVQAKIILTEMQSRLENLIKHNNEDGGSRTYIPIITGDFNSAPYTAAVQLFTKGNVPDNHADFYSGGKDEFVGGLNLTNNLIYSSACGFPQYTNFVTSFQQCLDYIFYDKTNLQVEKIYPQPEEDLITRETALPNATAPSDHIAQVVDFKWNPLTEGMSP